MANGIPVARIGDVTMPVERPEVLLAGTTYRQIGVRLWGQGAYERESIDGSQTKYVTLSRVESDDIIVNKIWARNGSVAVVTDELAGCFCSGEFPTFAPDRKKLAPRWFHWITKTKWFWKACDEKSRGTSGKNRIRPEKFLEIEIPLPPLTEQRRIVARIETLAARVAEAQSLRREAAEEAKSFMQATLREVFSESADWKTYKLDDVAPINMGQSPSGNSYNTDGEGSPLLNGPTEFSQKHPIPRQWTTSPTKFCKPGDILICVRGATTGRMNWADQKYCIGRGLAALTVDTEKCITEYVYYFVQTQTQEILTRTAGSTFPNLPSEKLKTLPIPVPPLEEQRRLVAYLEGLQEQVTALRGLQGESARELEALLPSVLARAFKGEL